VVTVEFQLSEAIQIIKRFSHATLQKPNLMLTGALALHPAGQHGRYKHNGYHP